LWPWKRETGNDQGPTPFFNLITPHGIAINYLSLEYGSRRIFSGPRSLQAYLLTTPLERRARSIIENSAAALGRFFSQTRTRVLESGNRFKNTTIGTETCQKKWVREENLKVLPLISVHDRLSLQKANFRRVNQLKFTRKGGTS
jgi:hypothetical protein